MAIDFWLIGQPCRERQRISAENRFLNGERGSVEKGLCRKDETESGTFSDAAAFRPYLTAVQFHQAFGQRQSQTGSLISSIFRIVSLFKGREDPFDFFRSHSYTSV